MSRTVALLVLAGSFVLSSSAEPIQGFVSDSHCGVKHDSATEANSKCVAGCLKHGSDPVVVQDGKVLTLDADSREKAKAFAGQEVKIDGVVDNGVLKINAIDKAQ